MSESAGFSRLGVPVDPYRYVPVSDRFRPRIPYFVGVHVNISQIRSP